MNRIISGVNAVRENLQKGLEITEILIAKERNFERVREIIDIAKKNGVSVKFKERSSLDKILPELSHQGVIAILNNYRYYTLDDLIKISRGAKGKKLFIIADHITDTRNLGSLIRTAEFFGVQGLILPKDRSASLTNIVHKISEGGSAYLPVARVVNLARAIDKLKKSALWIVGAEGASNTSIYEFDWDRDVALVVGSEDKGLSRVVKGRCDHLVSIPHVGYISSLNVSIASGIILSETVRQRGNPK